MLSRITIAIICCAIISTMIYLFYSLNQSTTISNNKNEEDRIEDLTIPPRPLLNKNDKPVSSVDEASKITGYEVPYPTYLPIGYSIQVMYAYDYGTVVMYAWNKAIEDTTYRDFYYIGNGMIIYIDDLSDRYSSNIVD